MPVESNLDPATDAALAVPPLISVLMALRERGALGLAFLSSGSTVYGDPSFLPVGEHQPTEPFTSYGVFELAGEKYVLMTRRRHRLQARILRCPDVYGEHHLLPVARASWLIERGARNRSSCSTMA